MKNRKIILICLNIIILILAVLWMAKSNYEYEPIIVAITAIITLIGLVVAYKKENIEMLQHGSNKSHDSTTVSVARNKNSKIKVNINKK